MILLICKINKKFLRKYWLVKKIIKFYNDLSFNNPSCKFIIINKGEENNKIYN